MDSRVRMEHGITVGSHVSPTEVACLRGGTRSVGAENDVQIVTFATPYDCSECTPHLTGVSKVVKEVGLAGRAFWVVWSPNTRAVEQSLARSQPGFPVCVNEDGTLWDRHNLLHTPFTAVIRTGRVVYMHDGLVSRREDERQLAADLKRLFAEE